MSKKQEKPPKFQWFRGSSSAWLIPSPISPLLFLQGVPKDIFHPPSCALRQCWAQPRIPQASDVEFICFKFKEVKFWFFFPSCSQPSSWTMNIPRSSKNLSVPLDSLQGSAPALSMFQDNQRAFPCSSPFGWDREFNQFMIDLKKKPTNEACWWFPKHLKKQILESLLGKTNPCSWIFQPQGHGMTNVGLQEGFTNNKISQDEALFHPGIPKPAAEKS